MGSEIAKTGSQEIEEPWHSGRVVGAVVDTLRITGGAMLPPSWKKIIGQHATELLKEDFPPDVVIAACYMAVLRGKPGIAQYVAGDLMLARAGVAMTEAEYEQKLALYAAGNGRAAELLAEQRERLAAREADIERRRNG